MSIFERSLKDYISPKFLSLSFATLIIPLLILGSLLVIGGGEIFDALSAGATSGDFSFIDASEHPFLVALLRFGVVKWIIATLFYTVGGLFAVLLSLVIAMIVLGFLTPMVVSTLHKKHYQEIGLLHPMKSTTVFRMMGMTFLKFFVLFIVCLPFLFIPYIINIPFFYLFYKLMIIDVGSNIMDYENFKAFEKKWFSKLILLSAAFFFLSLIPVIGIFLQLFFATYFAHFFFIYGFERKS